jgi:hypothetical protein
MLRFFYLVALILSFSIRAISQTTQAPCSPAMSAPTQLTAITRTGVGTPYTLTAIIKTEMKLPDGNTIRGFTTSRQALDSEGRTRVETPSYCAVDKNGQPYWDGNIMVTDPVAKTQTYWHEGLGSYAKATLTHMPFFTISNPPTAQQEYRTAEQVSQAYDKAGPQIKHDSQKVEDLGKRDIAGLEASGMRITRTSPAGMQGNSLPLIYVEEKWVSDEYGMILLDTNDDPIFGKSTYEVTDFATGEPDASLFQPPADYKINERTVTQ